MIKVQILGAGGAFSDHSTSYYINENIMVDLSESTVKSVVKKGWEDGILDTIKHLFITHRHQDHCGGLEAFLYYRLLKAKRSENNDKIDLTLYCGRDVYEYYKTLAVAYDEFNNGKYREPFNIVILEDSSSIVLENLNVNFMKTKHMYGTIPNYSLFFFDQKEDAKLYISGDMDNINPLITKELLENSKSSLYFHDMGWTGLEELPTPQVHTSEKDVYAYYGDSERIIGIHTDIELKHYKKANKDDIFYIGYN